MDASSNLVQPPPSQIVRRRRPRRFLNLIQTPLLFNITPIQSQAIHFQLCALKKRPSVRSRMGWGDLRRSEPTQHDAKFDDMLGDR